MFCNCIVLLMNIKLYQEDSHSASTITNIVNTCSQFNVVSSVLVKCLDETRHDDVGQQGAFRPPHCCQSHRISGNKNMSYHCTQIHSSIVIANVVRNSFRGVLHHSHQMHQCVKQHYVHIINGYMDCRA